MKGWYRDRQKHSLASRGIRTGYNKSNGVRHPTIRIKVLPNSFKIFDENTIEYEWFKEMLNEDVWMDFIEDLDFRGITIRYDQYNNTYKLINTTDSIVSYTNHQFYNDNKFWRDRF